MTLSDYSISRVHDFKIGDKESKTVFLQNGAYLFINAHFIASQITLLRVLNNNNIMTTEVIPPASPNEVIISGNNNTVVFSANGVCYGYIFRLCLY